MRISYKINVYVKYSCLCVNKKIRKSERTRRSCRERKISDRFKIYLFNAKLDATTLVQKHKIVALRGNDTLRAGPRVSPQTRGMMLRAFSSLLFFIRQYVAIPRFFFTGAGIKKTKERKGNASSLTGDDEKRVRARRTAFAVV